MPASRLTRLAMAGLLLVGWSAVPASPIVQDEPDAVCVNQHPVHLNPGVTLTPGRSNYSHAGGPIVCSGHINGHEVTGRDVHVEGSGVAVGDCSGGELAGTFSLTIPTPDGPTTLTMASAGTYGPGVGSYTADQVSVTFQFAPAEGDCVTTPLTEIAVVGEIVVEG